MKTIKYLFFAALTVFALAACKKDNNGENENEGNNEESVFVPAIEINGNMSDWAGIAGLEEEETSTGAYRTLKVTYDEKFVYFYSKRMWNEDLLWSDSSNGYYYYCIDCIPDAGDPNVNDQHDFGEGIGIDAWFYVFLFKGGAENPVIETAPTGGCSAEQSYVSHIVAAGRISSDQEYIETELSVPREDLPIEKGQTVNVYSWGNKSGYNLRNRPCTITIEK